MVRRDIDGRGLVPDVLGKYPNFSDMLWLVDLIAHVNSVSTELKIQGEPGLQKQLLFGSALSQALVTVHTPGALKILRKSSHHRYISCGG